MATRLFFHAASNTLSGTFPTGEQSAAANADYTATGANTLRKMDTTAGVSQASIVATTIARTTRLVFMDFSVHNPSVQTRLWAPMDRQ